MFSTMDTDEEAHLSSYICGYYIYNVSWSATVGEELQCAKSREFEGQICNLCLTRSRYNNILA